MSEIKNLIKSNHSGNQNQTDKFFSDFNQLYNLISNDTFNTNNNKKMTVYLWDNQSMINYIQTNILGGSQTLGDLMSTILNHFVDYHYPTQSIIKNDDLTKLNTAANRQLRLSTFNLYDKSLEFVNCRRLAIRDRYYKPVNFDGPHNYRFLIHKLEDNGLLAPRTETAYQVLYGKLFNQSNYHNLTVLQKILAKSRAQLLEDLDNLNNPVTVFLPTDKAFKDLRQDQINSLVADQACSYRFFQQYIVKDEICTSQLFKYEAEYSSHVQEASFISIRDAGKKRTFFNGQTVSEENTVHESSNGMFYFLDTLRINNMVDFMYDMVSYLKRRTSSVYFDSLKDDWRDVLLTESIKSTLLLPIEASILSSRDPNLTQDYDNKTNFDEANTKIDIRDYLIDSHETYYKLRDGQVLTSKTKRKYLINTFTFGLPQFLSWVPTRNFHIKAVNCRRIEINDLKGCSSQILFFHNKQFTLPPLNSEGLLEFISNDTSLSIFNMLINECGDKCLDIFRNLDMNSGDMLQVKKGHTVFIPSNKFFEDFPEKLKQLKKNSTHVEHMIKQNTLYGTYCEFYLRFEYKWKAKNLLGYYVKGDELPFDYGDVELDAYMSESSVLVHKVNLVRLRS